MKKERLILTPDTKAIIIKSCLFAVGIFVSLITLYHIAFAKRIIPGVRIGNVRLGGMTYYQAKKALQQEIDTKALNLKLTLDLSDQNADPIEFTLVPLDIDLVYDIDATVVRAYEVGRTGNFRIDTKDKLAGLIKYLELKFFYDFDDEKLANRISTIQGTVNKEARDASFAFESATSSNIVLVPSVVGMRLDTKHLYADLISAFDKGVLSQMQIPTDRDYPTITTKDLEAYVSIVPKYINTPIKIFNHKTLIRTLTSDKLLQFISLTKEGDHTLLSINKVQLETFLEELAREVDELPRAEVVRAEEGKVKEFKFIREGSKIDKKKFEQDFKESFFDKHIPIYISTNIVIGTDTAEDLGIRELIGEGKSKFVGSIPSRIHNLSLATERTHGVLIQPDGIYSFNEAIGEISKANGYDTAYIIQGGRTVLGEGGGVCQASTTMFRAVLNSGLPVVSRYPHDYRVGYYEQDSPVGFDASVFQPSLDFKFKNDTNHYILVQTSVNLDERSLTYKIYGTSDGRKVEISTPVITNVSAAPPTLYQDDPTLPRGVFKQIDFSASGANVVFTRKVTRDGKELFTDTFKSNYRPWRAIYLRGTR